MLRKKESYTVITPIPSFIPRQLALDILQSHQEVINLNPLVTSHKPISAPRNCAADEFYATWYEINQRIQFVPGIGKAGAGNITFNGCFHDMPWGLQTHIYAPANVDMRNRYRIGGNQPGVEPPEPRELGMEALGVPQDGLYLREDIEFKCNIAMVSYVKSQSKAASKEMVARIIKKAELLDAGVLQAMMLDGKLRTINPNDRSDASTAHRQSLASTGSLYRKQSSGPGSPSPSASPGYATPSYTTPSYGAPSYGAPSPVMYQSKVMGPPPTIAEAPSESIGSPTAPAEMPVSWQGPVEMPGDMSYSQPTHYQRPPQ